jgi:predicted nucleotidyltransferase
MTLLKRMELEKREQSELRRQRTREHLLEVLRELHPAARVFVFGSLTRAGRFSDASDVDFALESEPAEMSVYQLTSLVAERLGRKVDIVLLAESRLADKIRRESEIWMLQN